MGGECIFGGELDQCSPLEFPVAQWLEHPTGVRTEFFFSEFSSLHTYASNFIDLFSEELIIGGNSVLGLA